MTRWLLYGVLALALVNVLGGSMLWQLLGLGTSLEINGQTSQQRSIPAPTWQYYGGDAGGQRYAPISAINRDTVTDLGSAWTHRFGGLEGRGAAAERANFQATPILVADSLVYCTPFNEVIALDPGSGEERWRFDAEVSSEQQPANGYTCRGVAFWTASEPDTESTASCSERIFAATVDARLLALDARTGARCPSFGTNGETTLEPSEALAWPGEYQITSAPVVAGDVVIVGSAISDNLRAAAPAGTVHAFDARSGALRWTFDPIPRDPANPARASWQTEDLPGHANVWSSPAVDLQRGLVFLPTSSASPDFYGGLRPGDNRHTSAVVALHAATGELAWSFQTVHHDVWDYDVPSQPGLYTVTSADGSTRDIVAQATKTGMIFVLDRETGEPVIPVEERPVPQGGAAGEVLSPTQPFSTIPAVVPQQVSADDAFGITLLDRLACRTKLGSARNEGLFTPPSVDGTLLRPFTGGGANWGSAAFDPQRNLLVINMSNLTHRITLHPRAADGSAGPQTHEAEYAPMQGTPYGMSREIVLSPFGLPCSAPPWGVLAAVDLERGEIVWRTRFGSVRRFAGLDIRLGMPNFGGPLITESGLVFIGAAIDDYLHAFDIDSGALLWRGELPTGGQATPMAYRWQGREYIVIAAGGHKDTGQPLGDALVAFALPPGR